MVIESDEEDEKAGDIEEEESIMIPDDSLDKTSMNESISGATSYT